jgi:tetratricopeptide (TPR) repeat protein
MANAHVDLANVLQAKGQLDAAMAECRQAIALSPNLAAAHMALGILHLQRGELPAGWAEYEWRWHLTGEKMYRIDFPQPYWFGAALEGKRILLHAEQGLGDTLQFVRYAPLVAERGGRVILAVQPELMELMRSVKGVEQVVARLGPLPEFDTHCPLLSLPRLFQTTLETIPTGAPYLSADEKRRADWQARLPGDQRKKIGLVWAGKDWPNPNRSISPEELSALTSAPDAWWCSLQKQDAGGPPGLELTDWTGELQDFSDTAALIANLDLVITIDSATAHLAGALGKPVWVLLPFMADWRWMQDRSDSPWYPTARLFRQSRAGDWTGAIGHVIEALKGSC